MRKIQAPISPPLLTQDRRFHLDIGLQQRRTTSGIRNEKSYYKDGSCMEKLPREAAKSASVEIKKKNVVEESSGMCWACSSLFQAGR